MSILDLTMYLINNLIYIDFNAKSHKKKKNNNKKSQSITYKDYRVEIVPTIYLLYHLFRTNLIFNHPAFQVKSLKPKKMNE